MINFRTSPEKDEHWKVSYDGPVATLAMDVDEDGGLVEGYLLKLNSYDLGVDIELYDAVQRLRFEHPEIGAVVVTSGKDTCSAPAPTSRCWASSTHACKVNFCKFTNETRNGIEDASNFSGQTYLAAVNGTAPAAAMSSRSPATTSCWSTTTPRPCRCRRCRCWRCCRAPAA